ncbi:MAG: hypothetical protein H7249_12440 [Chitinophagaceae bacterium]|nr:hypothetical protein [Oligoflexus sp.]
MAAKFQTLAAIVLVAGSILLDACSSHKPERTIQSSKSGADAKDNGTEGEAKGAETKTGTAGTARTSKVEELSTNFGLLNFRQITVTFTGLTGVAMSAPAAPGGSTPIAEYNKALNALPADSAPAAITAGKVAAAGKLAAAYCDVLGNDAILLGTRFPGLSLKALPADSSAFAKVLVDGFYGPETSLQGDRAADVKIVASAVTALKALPGATGNGVFMATCAGIISSAEFFLY